MKTIKSVLAVLLALTFIMGFVACGNDDTKATTSKATSAQNDTSVNSDNATTATASDSKQEVVSVTNSPDKNVSTIAPLIKRTTNKKGNASASFIKSLKGYNLKVFYPWQPESKGSIKELKQSSLASMKAVEDEFGVTITEDGKFDNYNETLTAKLSARSVESQVYMVQDFNFASYFKNNYMTDLSSAMVLAGVDFKDPWYVQDANAFFNINYKQYAWVGFDAEYVFPSALIVYNKTLIKKAKLTDPDTLAQQGKWTWDTLIKYAKKLTTSSVIGLGGSAQGILESMLVQKGTSLVNVSKGKSPTPNISSQVVKDCLATVYSWCKDNKICNTFSNKDWTYGKTQFAAGKVAMIVGGHDTIQSLKTNKKTTDDFSLVQFPTQTGTKKYTNLATPFFPVFIPSQYSKDAAKILFLRNEMYRQNYRYALHNFTYQWNKYFQDKEVLNYACNIKYGRGNNTTKFSWTGVCEKQDAKAKVSSVVSEVMKNNGGVQTAISKYKDAIDTSYKSVWDGYRITGNV